MNWPKSSVQNKNRTYQLDLDTLLSIEYVCARITITYGLIRYTHPTANRRASRRYNDWLNSEARCVDGGGGAPAPHTPTALIALIDVRIWCVRTDGPDGALDTPHHRTASKTVQCFPCSSDHVDMPPTLTKQAKIALVAATVVAITPIKKERKKRKEWAKFYLKDRESYSHMRLIKDLDDEDFRIYLRMSSDSFGELLELVKPYITKTNTVMRKAVTAEERLVATLKYLASGREFRELKFGTSISSQLLSDIIPETCEAICKVLKNYIKVCV